MSEQNPNQDSFISQVGQGLGGLFKFLIRLVFVLILAVALGAGIYFGIATGIPSLDRLYMQPVRQNTSDIAALEARATQIVSQYSTQIAGMQERLTALEVQRDTEKESLAAIQSQVATLEPLLDMQEALALQLADLEGTVAALDEALAASRSSQAESIEDLSTAAAENQAALEALSQEVAALESFPADQVFLELQLVKAMALLTRSQVFIFQDNLGLAQEDAGAAREILAGLQGDASDISPILLRLDMALENLPEQSEQASADIQVAWELLVEGISGMSGAGAATPEPASTPTPTPAP